MSIEYNLSEEGFIELEEVIREFLSNYKYLFEIRIQKLIYYAELYSIENYGLRITEADFKPFHYGSFSDTVREALADMDLPEQSVRRHGNKTKRYLNYGVSSTQLSKEKKKVINRIHERTKSQSTDELAKLSKNSWLFDHLEKGESMEFKEYRSHLMTEFDIEEGDNWRKALEESENDLHMLQFYDEDAPAFEIRELIQNGGFYPLSVDSPEQEPTPP